MNPRDRWDSLLQFYAATDRERDGAWVARVPPLDWSLLKRQMLQESGGDPDAVSPVGAKGLAQAMDRTWDEWVRNEFGGDPPPRRHISAFDPEDAIRFQADYMGWLGRMFNWDSRKMLAAYNAGAGRVGKLVESLGGGWETGLPAETQDYLKRILAP